MPNNEANMEKKLLTWIIVCECWLQRVMGVKTEKTAYSGLI